MSEASTYSPCSLSGRDSVNLFAEPQWTVDHKDDGVPKFQPRMGLNYQFPLENGPIKGRGIGIQ